MYSADTALTDAGLPAYTTADWVSGNNGVGLGTLQSLGRIAIPSSTWKIAVITPAGTGIEADGTLPPNTTALAVIMPNVTGVLADGFEEYFTTVAKIEQATGYNFLTLLAEP